MGATRLTSTTSIGPGTVLGRYQIVERIGEGGMGEVWKAHDANLDRIVAIKMARPGALGDKIARERFHREALVLSRLSHYIRISAANSLSQDPS